MIIIAVWMIPFINEKLYNSSWINKCLIILSMLLLAAFIVYYYNNYYVHTDSYNRMRILGDTTNSEGSSAKRELYYQLAYESFLQNPLFGIGYQQFRFINKYGAISHSTYAEALASW